MSHSQIKSEAVPTSAQNDFVQLLPPEQIHERFLSHLRWRINEVRLGDKKMRQVNYWIVYGQIEMGLMARWISIDETEGLYEELSDASYASRTAGHGPEAKEATA